MTSNIYLASGYLDGIHVMKVGKADIVKQRQSQISIQIDIHGKMPSHKLAVKAERGLRRSAKQSGVQRITNTHDWFVFDHAVYVELAFELVCYVSPLIIASFYNSWNKTDRTDIVRHVRWFDQYMDKLENTATTRALLAKAG